MAIRLAHGHDGVKAAWEPVEAFLTYALLRAKTPGKKP